MRVAIITGGTRGLGRALTQHLVADGWRVVIDGRDPDAATAAATALGPRAYAIAGDVTDADHRRALVHRAAEFGRLDLLVNNASTLGVSPPPSLAVLPTDGFLRTLDVNVVSPLALAQLALPFLRASRGSIVNVTSDASVEPFEGWGGYGASKAALDQISAVLGVEEPGVRVWAFDPGDMRTAMHQEAFPGEDISDRPDPASVVPALLRLVAERPPSGRLRRTDLFVDATS